MEIREYVKHDLQLEEVEVVEIQMKKNCNYQGDDTEIQMPVIIEVKGNVINSQAGYSWIKVTAGNESGPFEIEVQQRGKFTTEKTLDEKTFERFLEVQGIKILWSYVRQTIFDITAKTGLTPYMLPTLDVVATLNKNIKE